MLRTGLVEQPRKLSGWFRIEKLERYYKLNLHGSVAQSVEQRPFKALVPGSSPGRPSPSKIAIYL
jgi:hypothetical protein